MSDFIVRFHGLSLSEEHTQRVQAAIQKAVMTEIPASSLSAYTPDPDGPEDGTLIFLPGHIWRGIIYMPAGALRNELNTINAGLQVVTKEQQF